jgi:hypothetical protein
VHAQVSVFRASEADGYAFLSTPQVEHVCVCLSQTDMSTHQTYAMVSSAADFKPKMFEGLRADAQSAECRLTPEYEGRMRERIRQVREGGCCWCVLTMCHVDFGRVCATSS